MKCIICDKEIELGKEWAILEIPAKDRRDYFFCGDDECHTKTFQKYRSKHNVT